jgi:putative FmdB family regulatory protein
MALYEYRCRTCDTTFEVRRPMAAADDAASCPDGHDDTVRLLSVFASVSASGTSATPATAASAAPAAPCGAHCACHPG